MNIFVVDKDPEVAAQSLCDRHVVKMVLETAQLLSTAHHVLDPMPPHKACHFTCRRYKPTHKNHPCAVWARRETNNYEWLSQHGLALCEEYRARYGREHRSQIVILQASMHMPTGLRASTSSEMTFPLCVPQDCWVLRSDGSPDIVESYREYYRVHKRHIAFWKRNKPSWWR